MNKKILFITPALGGKSSGGLQVTKERISSLCDAGNVTLVTLKVEENAAGNLILERHFSGGGLRKRNALGLFASYLSGLPISVWRNSPRDFLKIYDEINVGWDLLYVDHWLVLELAKNIKAKKRILHLHNAEHEIFYRAASNEDGIKKIVLRKEAERVKKYIKEQANSFDEIHVLSDEDSNSLISTGVNKCAIKIFRPAAEVHEIKSIKKIKNKPLIMFIGSLSWYPNAEGLRWFKTEVWGKIKDEVDFWVVGGGMDDKTKEILENHDGITIKGYVDDLDELYATCDCVVAPLISGSGIKIKIINSLARGVPVVTTGIGVEGFPRDWGEAILVGDDGLTFAEAIKKVVTNKLNKNVAKEEAQKYIKKYFDGREWKRWCDENS